MFLDKALNGQPIEITGKGRPSAGLVGEATYEAYKKAEFELKFSPLHWHD